MHKGKIENVVLQQQCKAWDHSNPGILLLRCGESVALSSGTFNNNKLHLLYHYVVVKSPVTIESTMNVVFLCLHVCEPTPVTTVSLLVTAWKTKLFRDSRGGSAWGVGSEVSLVVSGLSVECRGAALDKEICDARVRLFVNMFDWIHIKEAFIKDPLSHHWPWWKN